MFEIIISLIYDLIDFLGFYLPLCILFYFIGQLIKEA